MARFTDQFERHDPFKLSIGLQFPTWPTLAWRDALSLLEGMSHRDVSALADACERQIESIAQPWNIPSDTEHWIWTRVPPMWRNSSTLESSSSIRNSFGDLNLLLWSLRESNELRAAPLHINADDWQFLAAFAIWKLVDARDVTFGLAPMDIGGQVSRPNIRIGESAALAMEAQAAISHGQQLQMSARHLAEAEAFRDEIELLRNQARSASGGKAKGEGNRALKDEAIRLHATTTKRFVNLEARHRWIASQLEVKFGRTVASTTVGDWLREHKKKT